MAMYRLGLVPPPPQAKRKGSLPLPPIDGLVSIANREWHLEHAELVHLHGIGVVDDAEAEAARELLDQEDGRCYRRYPCLWREVSP
jgi:hypothetical protein